MPGLPHPAMPLVEQRKIVEYLLARDHPQGGAKARFFQAFGFEQAIGSGWRRHSSATAESAS